MIKLFDLSVFPDDLSNLKKIVETTITSNRKLVINPINAFILTLSQKDDKLKSSLLKSDIITADGQSIIWAAKFLKYPVINRIAGIDLMYDLLELSVKNNYTVFLWGATDQTLGKIKTNSQLKKYENIIAGVNNGYFTNEEIPEILNKINNIKPNFVFLGMNTPKKEILSIEIKDKIHANIIMSVGGSLEVLAGNKKRAPQFFQNLGLEWLYRLSQEPQRLFLRYLISNTVFIKMVLFEKYNKL